MSRSLYRSLFIVVAGMALCLAFAPAARAVNPADPGTQALARSLEAQALDVEGVFQQLLVSNEIAPVVEDLGGGFHSLSIALPDEVRDRLLEAFPAADSIPGQATGPTFLALATGQQLTTPSSASTLIDAALADTSLVYNYWVVVLNLNNQTLSKKTTFNITGPRKLSRNAVINYGGNAIWIIWYNPGIGLGTSGVYTLKATVSGGGSASSKFLATH